MSEQAHEFTGKTTNEAIQEGLNQLSLRQDQVDIEIISKGSRGIFGIGSEPARVRITPLPEPKLPTATPPKKKPAEQPRSTPENRVATEDKVSATETKPPTSKQPRTPATTLAPVAGKAEVSKAETGRTATDIEAEDEDEDEAPESSEWERGDTVTDEELTGMATEMLGEMIRLMGFNARVVSSWRESDDGSGPPNLVLDIRGDDVSALIGRQGETLASIQYLVRLMVNQRIKQWKNIIVDVEQYKERRVDQLTQLALRMAEQVVESGRAVSLEPMPANERRIVHIALRDHAEVYTQSSGEGDRRKVNIVAKDS